MTGRVWGKAAVLFLSLLSVETASLRSRDEPLFLYREQIKCIGDVPFDWRYLRLAGSPDGHEETEVRFNHPRHVCAATRYGGNPLWNIGMSCPTSTEDDEILNMPAVSDGRLYDLHVPQGLYGEMVEFCGLRCRCIYAPPSSMEGPAYGAQEILASEAPLPAPYDFNHRYDVFRPGRDTLGLRTLALPVTDGQGRLMMRENGRYPIFQEHFPDERKYKAPACFGPIPEWQLPRPFGGGMGGHRFEDIRTLCRASWFRGANIGNAGFVCQLNPISNLYDLKTREFLSHPSLSRYNKHQPMRGAAVEAWCRRFCRCVYGALLPKLQSNSLDLGNLGSGGRTTAYFPPGGGVNFRVRRSPGLSIGSVTFSATNGDENDGRQACLAGIEEQCSVEDSMAAVELHRKKLRKQRPRPSTAVQEPICGGTCEKSSDCTTTALKNDDDDDDDDDDNDDGCRCQVIQTPKQAQDAGWGPFYPSYQSLCLPALASFKSVGLGGRGLDV